MFKKKEDAAAPAATDKKMPGFMLKKKIGKDAKMGKSGGKMGKG